MNKQLLGFMEFVREQGVLGLAIGLVLGTAVKNVVDSLVVSFINPILGAMLGGVDLSSKKLCLNEVDGLCENAITWGAFLNNVIQFVAVAAVVYFVANKFIQKIDKKKSDK